MFIFYIQNAPNCSKVFGAVKRSLDVYGCKVSERISPTDEYTIADITNRKFWKRILRKQYMVIANKQDQKNNDYPHKLLTKVSQNFEV